MMLPPISVAPMMGYTDRHARYFLRLIAPSVRLYTEMITAHALMHGDAQSLLTYHELEHPIALQLGGSHPDMLAKATQLGSVYQYDEINLNIGCPSPRVSKGRFGACLMLEPALVADCVYAMREQTSRPITVKCRIGVDACDDYHHLQGFIEKISQAGCKTFIVHARKAWLSGLNPKQNREIPPLRYEVVYQLKKDFSHLNFILNGGIKTISEIDNHLNYVDGIMIGRAAYANPYLLADIHSHYFLHHTMESRVRIIKKYIPYVSEQLRQGVKLASMIRPILGLFQGQVGASLWRRHLSEKAHKPGAGIEVIEQALQGVSTSS